MRCERSVNLLSIECESGYQWLMNKPPRLPPIHDCVRAYGATLDETVFRLLNQLDRRAPDWGYVPFRAQAAWLFSHEVPLNGLLHGLTTKGSPSGRKPNADVARLLWQHGEGRVVRCSKLATRSISLRRDAEMRVPVDFRFSEAGVPGIFWTQARKGFAFTPQGLGVLGSIFRMLYLVDDFESAKLEILDLSAIHGERTPVVYGLENLPMMSDEEVTAILQRVADAYDVICAMDRDWSAGAGDRTGKKAPPMGPGLFG